MPTFVSGIELARGYYSEVIAPLVDVPHAAGRLGWGSDVLGYDTERSTDHGWGPHLHVLVTAGHVEQVRAVVDANLPDAYAGWPTRFGWDAVTPRHWVEVMTVSDFLVQQVGVDPRPEASLDAWLRTPQQFLLQVTSGEVFHDDTGELTAARALLAWYPHVVWLWALACQWQRIAQEEPFVARAASVGDHLGSAVIAARQVRDIMRLAFLIERRYAPYSKWLGTAFMQLQAGPLLEPLLRTAVSARNLLEREDALGNAYILIAERFNDLGVCEPVAVDLGPFHSRPAKILRSNRFVDACLAALSDDDLRTRPLIGTVDQWSDNTDLLERPDFSLH